ESGQGGGGRGRKEKGGGERRGASGVDERRGLSDESPERCRPVPVNMAEGDGKLGCEREQRRPQSDLRPEHTHQGASPMPTYPSAGAKPNLGLEPHNPLERP